MTTEATVPDQNTTTSATHARWVRLCRIPFLFAFALVAYEAVRLPLAARSTDPAADVVASVTTQDDASVTDVHATTDDLSSEQLAVATADDAEHEDVMTAVMMQGDAGGDSAEPFPADLIPSDDAVEPADHDPWEAQVALAFDTGNQLVADVVETLANGTHTPVDDTALFGPEADHLVVTASTEDVEPSVATETTSVETSPVETNPAVDVPQFLVLVNPSDVEIGYLVNGEVHRLGPGERHEIGSDQNWAIEFHRGGDFGEATYELSAGTYEFRVGDSGWELRQ
jgi:hypothetical protein